LTDLNQVVIRHDGDARICQNDLSGKQDRIDIAGMKTCFVL
jgi:hypothetical protein